MTDNKGFDFKAGVPLRQIPDGAIVAGHVDDDEIVVVRRGDEYFAVGAHCTHYHGPLADGLIVGDTVRCPWHHACFSLRTGEAVRAPALDAIGCWRTERHGDMVFVREKLDAPTAPAGPATHAAPRSVVVVGGGAAGLAAADMLRRLGYAGTLTMLSADAAPPVDRPNLSKDYLAGTAKEDWIPLRSPEYFTDNEIDLQLEARVASIDVRGKRVRLDNGTTHAFDALLLATGAEPVRLSLAGAPAILVHYLRTFADSRAIVTSVGASKSKRALVIGASFIGLEVAASLRTRGLDVHVVAPEREPLEKIMGPEVGGFIRGLHESKGVVFHLGATVARLDGRVATLSDGSTVDADFAVAGVGVRPNLALAEAAGLASIAVWSLTSTCRRVRPASSPPATSPAGPIRTPASAFASSTGWSRSARARRPPATSSASVSGSATSRSSGASTTTSASTTSGTRSGGTRRRSMAISPHTMPRSPTRKMAERWLLRRCSAIRPASRRK